MLSAINNSIEHLCEDILGTKLKLGKSLGKGFYGSCIPFIDNNIELVYYIFLKKDTLNQFAYGLLGEENLHEEDLNDLCKEIANLIIGYAKSYLNDKNPNRIYKLGTPKYLGQTSKPFALKFDDFNIYKLKNRTFMLGVKKVNE